MRASPAPGLVPRPDHSGLKLVRRVGINLEREIGFLIGAHFGIGIGIAIGIVHRESIPDIDPDSDADTGRGIFHPMGMKQNTQFVNRDRPFCRFGPLICLILG